MTSQIIVTEVGIGIGAFRPGSRIRVQETSVVMEVKPKMQALTFLNLLLLIQSEIFCILLILKINRIRKVDRNTGIITTFGGDGFTNNNQNNVPALSLSIVSPRGIFVDYLANFLYYSDLTLFVKLILEQI
jgi:hypothetical protein